MLIPQYYLYQVPPSQVCTDSLYFIGIATLGTFAQIVIVIIITKPVPTP